MSNEADEWADKVIADAFGKMDSVMNTPVEDMRNEIMIKALGKETLIFHEGEPYINWHGAFSAIFVAMKAMGPIGAITMVDELNQIVLAAIKVRDNGPQGPEEN